jgi:hypothetical protein
MPLINGRYYINPTMGEALEAARDAESALLALQKKSARDSQSPDDTADEDVSPSPQDSAPVHRVEIDAAEVVPNSTGRATRGYVARVHRGSTNISGTAGTDSCGVPPSSSASAPETHVFTDHRDLVSFLRDLLASASS